MSGTLRVLEPFVVGLQLARLRAQASLVIVQRTPGGSEQAPVGHQVVYVARWPVAAPYPVVVTAVRNLLKPPKPPRKKAQRFDPMGTTEPKGPFEEQLSALVVNATSVSLAALELIRDADPDQRVVPAWITEGDSATESAEGWRVPRSDLVGVVQVLLQQNRLEFAKGLPGEEELYQQLDGFQVKDGTTTGKERYEAVEGDDLALALALALWWGETVAPTTVELVPGEFHAWSPEALRYEYEKRRRSGTRDLPVGPLPESIG